MNVNMLVGGGFFISSLLLSSIVVNVVSDVNISLIFVIVLISIISIPMLHINKSRYNYLVIGALIVSIIYIFYCVSVFNIFPAIDAVRYYDFLLANNSSKEILLSAIDRTQELHDKGTIDGPGSFFIFGMPVHLFYLLMPDKNPYYVIIFNYIFKIISVFIVSILFERIASATIRSILIALIIVSPTLNYFITVMGKDIFILFLTLLLALLIVNIFRAGLAWQSFFKIVFLLFLMIYCYFLRPYSPAVAIVYAFFSLQHYCGIKWSVISTMIIIGFLAVTKSILILFNWPMIFAFMYLFPNPANLSNYEGFTLFPVICVFILALIFVCKAVQFKEIVFDKKALSSFLCVFIYAGVMTLVGFYATPVVYSLGSVGDEVFRKQLLIMPIVLLSILYFARVRKSGGLDEE